MDLSKVATCYLVNEIQNRLGVTMMRVGPYDEYAVSIQGVGESVNVSGVKDTGPALILVVVD